MKDFLLKNEVESFLENHSIGDFSNVKVFVQKGVVLLVGKVLTNREKDFVRSAVDRLPGVEKVISKLELASEAPTAKLPPLASIVRV
jgi:osmotically-inducible protein OsmY